MQGKKSVNLPRYGIFLPHEHKYLELEMGPAKTQDRRPKGPVDADFFFNCFLCDIPLSNVQNTSNQDTDEHVFAQWMQKRFGIANQPICASDPNSTTCDNLRIPACARCNNAYLSAFEDRIRKALISGFDSFARLRTCDVFLWCAKIYYALIHDRVIPRDWTTRKLLEPELPQEFLSDLRFLRILLQGFRRRVFLQGLDFPPYSVLLFRLHSGRDPGYFFGVRYSTTFPAIALQLGPIGIVVICDDYGECELFYKVEFEKILANKTLAPIQFWELAGLLFYRSTTVPVATAFTTVFGENEVQLLLTAQPEQYLGMDPAKAAFWIGQLTNQPPELFWNAKTQTSITSLFKPDRTFNEQKFVDISPPLDSVSSEISSGSSPFGSRRRRRHG